ncbi:MAG: MaoC family dehydratase N-terminal domain-containing protein [Actinomycetota bacterium]
MPIDHSAIGRVLDPVITTLERGRLAFFAQAIGETDPVYFDLTAARAAGHPDLPVPPTFIFGALLDVPDPFEWIAKLGVDMRFVLHGTEKFSYHRMLHAGDTVTVQPTITNVYDKRGGSLEFVVTTTTVTTAAGELAVTMDQTLVVRHPEAAA